MKQNGDVNGAALAQPAANSTLSADARFGPIDVIVDPDAEQIGDLVRDTVAILPVKPVNVSHIQRPHVQVQLTEDPQAVEVRVEHGFRAHFGALGGNSFNKNGSSISGKSLAWPSKRDEDGGSSSDRLGHPGFAPELPEASVRKFSEEEEPLNEIDDISFNMTLKSLPRDLNVGNGNRPICGVLIWNFMFIPAFFLRGFLDATAHGRSYLQKRE